MVMENRRVASAAAVTTAVTALLLGPAPSAFAADGDCADLVRTYTKKASRYALIKNHCNRQIRARAVVNNWPDSSCQYIAAGATRVYRTGGSFSPRATSGREC